MLTKREQLVLQEIKDWLEQLKEYHPSNVQLSYGQWLNSTVQLIPEDMRHKYVSKIDEWLFYASAWLQDSTVQKQGKKQILGMARVFSGEVDQLPDLKKLTIDQLNYISEQQLARQRLYSLLQGAISGTGSSLFISLDMPVLMLLNLRAVQLTAMSYGYEMNSPFEIMLSLKVFHAATLPKHWQGEGWDYLMNEIQIDKHSFLYEGNESMIGETWFESNCNQLLKSILLLAMKKNISKRNPLLSVFVSGGTSYRYTRQLTDYARRFYQYRHLSEKHEKGEVFFES